MTKQTDQLESTLLRADGCYASEDYSGAIEALNDAAKVTDRHPTILRALGTQLFLSKRYTWSRIIFDELTTDHPQNVDDHILHALAAFYDEDSDSCAAALQNALALAPANHIALKFTADLDVREKRYVDAILKYELIAEKHGISPESLHALAYCQYKTGDQTRALDTYQQLITFNEQDGLAKNNLKVIESEQSVYEKTAAEPVKSVVENKAQDEETPLDKAEFFKQAGNNEAALKELESAVLNEPHNQSLVEGLGAMYFNAGDYENARKQFRHLIELIPTDATAYVKLSMSCYQLGQIQEFECALGLAMELSPENPELLHFLGKVNIDTERFYDAGRCFAKLAELEPDNVQNLLALGKCLFQGGEHETAESAFERALELDPENSIAIENLTQLKNIHTEKNNASDPTIRREDQTKEHDTSPLNVLQGLISNGEYAEAAEHLNAYLAEDPQNEDLLSALGTLQFNSKQFTEAIATFEKICNLDGENVDSHLKVAGAAFFAEVYEKFEEHLHFVLEREPENAYAIKLLAAANFKSQNFKEATSLYIKVNELMPEDVESILALGMCFHHQSDNLTAIDCFKRALELDPNNGIASENLITLEQQHSNLENTESNEFSEETLLKKNDTAPHAVVVGNLHFAQELLSDGKPLESWKETLRALELRPFHPDAYLHLAEIALSQNDEFQARICLERLISLTPEWDTAKSALESLSQITSPKQSEIDWPNLPEQNVPPTITACLIVKNESEFIGQCLESIKRVASQIVVVDTGSDDDTIQIAESHGAQVFQFDWCDDFAAARNFGLEKATGDWLLIIDADEVLTPEGMAGLWEDIQQKNHLGFRVRCNHLERISNNEGHQQMADGWHFIPRLFRNAPGIHFVGIIHEQAFSSVQVRSEDWQMETGFGRTEINHFGYDPGIKQERKKAERNITLINRALDQNPDDATLLMSLALDLYNEGHVNEALDKTRVAFELVEKIPSEKTSPEVRERLVSVYCNLLLQSEQYDELITVASSSLAIDCGPTSSILYMKALAFFKSGQPQNAVTPLEEAIKCKTHQTFCAPLKGVTGSPPHHLLADALVRNGEFDRALDEYKTALQLSPENTVIRHDLAKLLATIGQVSESMDLLNESIQKDLMSNQLWALGCKLANETLKDPTIALQWTECAFEAHSDAPEIKKHRSIALITNGQYQEALNILSTQPATPESVAGRILCELVADNPVTFDLAGIDEKSVSIALVYLCRRTLELGNLEESDEIVARVQALTKELPTAARVLAEME